MWKTSPLSVLRNFRPLVMAHRGDSAKVPENTLPAFQDAYNLHVDCIETDVRMTQDHQFVFLHDKKLNRTTNVSGLVEDFTLAQVQSFDAGFQFKIKENGKTIFPYRGKGLKIEKVDEIVPQFPNVRFNMDIKTKHPDAPHLLAEKLKDLHLENRIIVASFHDIQIQRFRSVSTIPTSASPKEVIHFRKIANLWVKKNRFPSESANTQYEEIQKSIFGFVLPFKALQIPEKLIIRVITPAFVQFAHMVGIAVQVWTINTRPQMEKLLKWGVDGIFSDKPGLLLQVMKDLGYLDKK